VVPDGGIVLTVGAAQHSSAFRNIQLIVGLVRGGAWAKTVKLPITVSLNSDSVNCVST